MNIHQVHRHGFGSAWLELLSDLYYNGEVVAPRGKGIREIRNTSLQFENSLANVLDCDARRPNYRFMVAEWLWITFGHDDVKTIAQYNPNIANYSDDGVTFAGAYGPPLKQQWSRVERLLKDDPDTRQAVINIYRPPHGPTKDVPCTIALQFFIRDGTLHTTAYMRSSDIMLGLPYDAFNFSMIGNTIAALLNKQPGSMTLHLGSSHLYESDTEKAKTILDSEVATILSPKFPEPPPSWLNEVLMDPEYNWFSPTIRSPWKEYARVLQAPSSQVAKAYIKGAYVATF